MKIKIKVREYDGYHYLIPNNKVDSFDLLTKLHSESRIGSDEEEELFTKIDYVSCKILNPEKDFQSSGFLIFLVSIKLLF